MPQGLASANDKLRKLARQALTIRRWCDEAIETLENGMTEFGEKAKQLIAEKTASDNALAELKVTHAAAEKNFQDANARAAGLQLQVNQLQAKTSLDADDLAVFAGIKLVPPGTIK